MLAYLDTKNPGETVLRRDLLNVTYGRSENINRSTVDKWRRQLTVLGYLIDTCKPGLYVKGKNIPRDLTTTQLEKRYTEENF